MTHLKWSTRVLQPTEVPGCQLTAVRLESALVHLISQRRLQGLTALSVAIVTCLATRELTGRVAAGCGGIW